VDVARLHVDLAPGLGHIEMDHARQFGAAGAVLDERRLHGVDTCGHRQRVAHIVALQDPHGGGHAGSLPDGLPAGQPPAMAEYVDRH